MTDGNFPAAQPRQAPQPSALMDLLLTVVLPSVVLESLSAPSRLGPAWALALALLPPLGFMVHCWVRRLQMSVFSWLGLAMVMLSGLLGLLTLSAKAFAIKEAVLPLILGLAFPLSQRSARPLTAELLLNAQVINRPWLEQWLRQAPQRWSAYQRLMARASWVLAAVMACSALLNGWMILWFLGDAAPGSEDFVKAIGRQNWMGLLVIGVPCAFALMGLMSWLMIQLERQCEVPRQLLLRQAARRAP